MAERKEERSRELQRSERGGLARRGEFFPSLFSMTPREFFSANPFELMRRFTDEMNRAFTGTWREERAFMPPVEIRQKGDNLIISAELPGIKKEDVKLEMTDEGLLIQGERKREEEEREEGFYRSERSYGRFARLIPLPEGANIDQTKAQFNNGVLEVTVPVPQLEKKEKRREIPIEAGERGKIAGGGGGD